MGVQSMPNFVIWYSGCLRLEKRFLSRFVPTGDEGRFIAIASTWVCRKSPLVGENMQIPSVRVLFRGAEMPMRSIVLPRLARM